MSRAGALILFLLCSVYSYGQDARLQSLMGMTTSQWDVYYNQHKAELADSTIDRWRSEAITLYGVQKFDEAHQVLDICIRFSTLSNNSSLIGTSWLAKAETYYNQEEYTKALSAASEAAAFLLKAGNRYQLARSKNRIGVSSQALNDQPNAIKAFEEAIALKKQLLKEEPSNTTFAESLYGSMEAYGNALYQFEKYKEAIPVYREAITAAQKSRNGTGEGAMNYNLGLVHYLLEIPKESRLYFERSIAVYNAASDSGNVVNSYRQILRLQEFLHLGDDYATMLEKALAYGKKMSDKTQVLRLVETCLQPFKRTEEYGSQLYFYNQKLQIFGTAYPDSIYSTYVKVAVVYENQNKYTEAIQLYEKLLKSFDGTEQYYRKGHLLESIGSAYQSGLEDYKKADYYFQQSADQFKKGNEASREAGAYWSKGYNQSVLMKDYAGGIMSYQKALAIYTTEKDTITMSTMLENIGVTYADLNDSIKSYRAFHQALDLTKKYSEYSVRVSVYNKFINTCDRFKSVHRKLELSLQRYKLALAFNDNAEIGKQALAHAALLEERNRHEADAYFAELANSEDKKFVQPAIQGYTEALKYYREQKDTANAKTLLCNMGVVYRIGGDSINAYRLFDEALDLTRKASDETLFVYVTEKAVASAEVLESKSRQLHYLNVRRNFYDHRKMTDKGFETSRAIGKIYQDSGDYARAIPYFESLVNYHEQKGDTTWMEDSYWNLGYNVSELEAQKVPTTTNYQRPLDLYRKAMNLYVAQRDTSNWKIMLTNMAVMYRNMDDSVAAYRTNEEAIALTRNNSDRDNLIYAYKKASETARYFKHYRKQIKYLEQKLAVERKQGEAQVVAETLETIGKIYEDDLKIYLKANELFRQMLTEFQKTTSKIGIAGSYWNIAYNLTIYQKKYKEGLDLYGKAITLYKEEKDSLNASTILSNIAIGYRNLNDSVNCYKYHHQSISFVPKKATPSFRGDIYTKAAASYGKFGHYAKQIAFLEMEVETYRGKTTPTKVSEAIRAVAKVYQESFKDYKKSDALCREAIDMVMSTSDLDAQAHALWSYSFNLGLMSREKEAIDGYEKAFTIFITNKDTSNASVMRSNVAQTLWGLEDFDKAIKNHEEAIALATKGKNQEMIYKSWNALADLYKQTGNPVKGTEALSKAIVALEIMKDSSLMASAYTKIATSYSKAKEYNQSFVYYDKAVTLNKHRKDTAAWASALFDWGLVLNEKKDYSLAREKVGASLPLYRKIRSKADEVYSLVWMGILEQSTTNDYKKAEAWYTQAVSIAKPLNNDNLLAFCYYQMRILYRSTGRAALADENAEKSLVLYRKLKNWPQVANTLMNIGQDAHLVYGDINKALRYFDEAQAIADTLTDKTYLASIIGARATVYSDQGEFSKALEVINTSYELYKSQNNEWGIAGVYIDKGNVYRVLSEYEIAMKYQGKADSMYLKLGTEYARLAPLANIGENYVSQGNYPKGLEYSMKAYEIMRKAGDEDVNMCIIKSNIGDIYYQMGNYADAEKWLTDAMANSQKAAAKRVKMDILGELARLKIEQKKYTEAATLLNEGIQLGKETGIILGYLNNLVLQGKLLVEQKQFEKAKAPLEETYLKSKNIGKDNTLWESLYLLGVAYKNTGDLLKSKEYLIEAEKVIEKVRNKVVGGDEAKKLFSSDKNVSALYDALVEVLLARGETEEAMTVIQKNNEENLKAKFKGIDVKFENEKKQRAVEEERQMKAKLDGIDKQISLARAQANNAKASEQVKALEGVKTVAESEYLKFVNQQINVQPELSKYFNNSVQPVQFRKVKSKIPKDMALLSYLAGEQQLYIFAATSDTVVAKIVTVPRAQLTKDINAMLNIVLHNLGTFPTGDSKDETGERQEIVNEMKQTDPMLRPFEDAYHYLIAPVANEIKGKTKLGVIPTGALNYIPFQLLGKTLSNGEFSLLVNQFAIFYANSTDMLFRNDAEIDKKYNILAFGNPDSSLPSTENEVKQIKSMYPNASVFFRGDATEDKAKFAGEEYNVMHFATHGNLDYEDFSQSFITMAGNPSKSEDGRLTLEELWGMEVMNHLNIVVLSACQTAVTKGSNESSAVSPASGFLQNGVKSVVASLWKVDDEATSILMTVFYRNIKTMNPVDALRASQRDLSKNPKFAHPYFWAGFILLGDWR